MQHLQGGGPSSAEALHSGNEAHLDPFWETEAK